MNDIAHIGFVNAHAKSVCRNHDRLFIINKIFLALHAFSCAKPRMVPGGCNSLCQQLFIEHVCIFAGCAVNNAAFLCVLLYVARDEAFFFSGCLDGKIEVFAVKSGHEHLRVLQPEHAGNVFFDVFSRRCGKCAQNRALWQPADKLHDI